MERDLQPGDKVRYTRPGPIDWEISDWAEASGLKMNEVYEVSTVHRNQDNVTAVNIKGAQYNIHPGHFSFVK